MTLTKAILFEKLKPVVTKCVCESLGTFYVKPRTELQRCKRLGQLYDAKGNPVMTQMEKRRAYMIIDQVCSEDGEQIFSESDLPEILSLESEKLDPILEAIQDINGELEKKDSDE